MAQAEQGENLHRLQCNCDAEFSFVGFSCNTIKSNQLLKPNVNKYDALAKSNRWWYHKSARVTQGQIIFLCPDLNATKSKIYQCRDGSKTQVGSEATKDL